MKTLLFFNINLEQKRIKISPLAKRIAELQEIDITKVIGTGPNGRIIKRDLEDYIDLSASNTSKHTFNEEDNKRVKKLSNIRKTIALRLQEAKSTIPHFYLKGKVQLDTLVSERTKLNNFLKENNEVKRHKPKFNKLLKNTVKKFALEICENSIGNLFLRISHFDERENYLEYYSSLKVANKRLEGLNKIYGIKDSNAENNNSQIKILEKDLSFKYNDMLIIDKGRSINEKSVILIKNNKYIGYGFFSLNYQINNIEILESLIVKNESIDNSKELILKYLRKNKCEKIINLEINN